MQIQINEIGKVIGYATVGGFVDGAEVETIPEGFAEAFQPGKYRYENGKILEDPDFTPPVDNTALLNQIGELKAELRRDGLQSSEIYGRLADGRRIRTDKSPETSP